MSLERPARFPFLNVQIGDEKRVVSFPTSVIGGAFGVPPTEGGVRISISTGKGTDAPPSTFFFREERDGPFERETKS